MIPERARCTPRHAACSAVLTLYFPTASLRIAAGAMLESMFGIDPKDTLC